MNNFGHKNGLSSGRRKWLAPAWLGIRKKFSFAVVAALLLLTIGASACLYTPAIPEDPTPIPGWDENKVQLQKGGRQLERSVDSQGDLSPEVVSSIAANPRAITH